MNDSNRQVLTYHPVSSCVSLEVEELGGVLAQNSGKLIRGTVMVLLVCG